MSQEIVVAAIGIIAANLALLTLLLAYILPKNEECVKERKETLNSKIKGKPDEGSNKSLEEIFISVFGGLDKYIEEKHALERWTDFFSETKNYIIYSIVFSVIALLLTFLTIYNSLFSIFPFSEALLLVSIIYFLLSVSASLKHRQELHDWRNK